MCDCIEKIHKQIIEIDPEGFIKDSVQFLNKEAKVGDDDIYKTRMCGFYRTRIKKNGKYTNKCNDTMLNYSYCPFCGEKYD